MQNSGHNKFNQNSFSLSSSNSMITSNSGALNPRETPSDSILAARIASFLEGSTAVLRRRGFQPQIEWNFEDEVDEERYFVAGNERSTARSRRQTAADDAATVGTPAIVDENSGLRFFFFYLLCLSETRVCLSFHIVKWAHLLFKPGPSIWA